VVCYDQNQSGLEERIITQDSDIFWTTYTPDLSSEGEGENQFPEGTEYVKFNIVVTSEGPIWFDNAIFANEKNFTYNAANQITNTGFAYDDNGNLTSDGTYTCLYDGENRLKEVKQGTTTIATYTYDYMGRRTSKTVSGQTTYFHYDGWNVVAETDASGTTTATYAYDFYQYNDHGDVVSLTNSAGQIVNTYNYDPWGKVLSANVTVENPYRYAGYRYDTETRLYHLQHRHYDPSKYCFLIKDPSIGDIRTPLTLNPYSYCTDDPINKIDPDGLWRRDVHFDDTLRWARSAGFSDNEAARIAYADTAVDRWYPPPPRGAGYFRHFDPLGRDSRDSYAEHYLQLAMQTGDVFYVGLGLHSLQDKYAHGRIFRQTEKDKWRDDRRQNKCGYIATQRATFRYLQRFLNAIGKRRR